MERKEWTFRGTDVAKDRFYEVEGEWPEGPWDNEPDKVQWPDEATGLPCLVLRNRMGAWCGYVGLPPGHPWRELSYDDIPATVHGGLTFGPSPCSDEKTSICHEVEPGESDDVMWIGFDCLHAFDQAPGMIASHQRIEKEMGKTYEESQASYPEHMRETYKDLPYVRAETTYLALQAKKALDG